MFLPSVAFIILILTSRTVDAFTTPFHQQQRNQLPSFVTNSLNNAHFIHETSKSMLRKSPSSSSPYQSVSLSMSISDNQIEMPWSKNQEWALQDKISKYTINIPSLNNPTLKGGGINKATFALWHTMRKETTEIMGYDIDYLYDKYATMIKDENGKTEDGMIYPPPGVLPFIDEFEFCNNGGMKGKVYGLFGIEPGTEIVTSPLKDVELTLPKGFVMTQDGICAYELGITTSERLSIGSKNIGIVDGVYSMDLSAMREDGTKLVSNVGEQSGRLASNVVEELGDPKTSQMIVNLASTTAILLGGATAMNMLSHHLTVNVFWV